MSGSVTIVIKYEDGRFFSTEGWTNSLPRFVQSFGIRDTHEHLLQYEAEALAGCTKHEPMAYPTEYGIIVFDEANRHIRHMQGYSNLIESLDVNNVVKKLGKDINEDDYLELREFHLAGTLFMRTKRFKALKGSGRTGAHGRRHVTTYDEPVSSRGWDFDDFLYAFHEKAFTARGDEGPGVMTFLFFDIAPWTIERLGYDFATDSPIMHQYLVDLGYTFTPNEKAGWAEWMRDHAN